MPWPGRPQRARADLALRIAETFQGEIVNYDSVQIYRQFDIGTAKLPDSQRRGVPHHLIDIVEPGELFTAGEYARQASAVVREIAARGRIPVLAGGTGFYLRALLEGLSPGPERDETLRETLTSIEAGVPGALHRLLGSLDPEAARRIHANDTHKLIRALELRMVEGKPAVELFTSRGKPALPGFRIIRIGLDPPRPQLYARINARVVRMFEAGLIEETRSILSRAQPAPPSRSNRWATHRRWRRSKAGSRRKKLSRPLNKPPAATRSAR